MKVYLSKSLLADSKQIEACQKQFQAISDSLKRARNSLVHLESERGRIQQRIDYAKTGLEQVSVPKLEPSGQSNDPGIRDFQRKQLEADYKARLTKAQEPFPRDLKFLETELDEWQRQHGQELDSLKQDVSTLEKRLRELESKLEPFVAVDASGLIYSDEELERRRQR